MNSTILSSHGIDYQNGLRRCMQDAGFYGRILGMFLQDEAFEKSRKALWDGDFPAMSEHIHELKGTSANAALTELYDAVCPLMERLRSGETDAAEIVPLFQAVERAYTRTRGGIEQALAG